MVVPGDGMDIEDVVLADLDGPFEQLADGDGLLRSRGLLRAAEYRRLRGGRLARPGGCRFGRGSVSAAAASPGFSSLAAGA